MTDLSKLPVLILAYNRYDKFIKCFDKETPESESAMDIIDSLGKFITQH